MEKIDEIIALKENGLKNDEIANKLNIPVGTIKSRLFRYKNKNRDKTNVLNFSEVSFDKHCRTCGKEIKSIAGKKEKQFCSDYCRVKYWRMQKNDKKRI